MFVRKLEVALPSCKMFGLFDLSNSIACLNSEEWEGCPIIETSYASKMITRQPAAGENDWNNWPEEEVDAHPRGILLQTTDLSGQQ